MVKGVESLGAVGLEWPGVWGCGGSQGVVVWEVLGLVHT